MSMDKATAKARRVWDKAAPRYDSGMSFWDRRVFAGGREWVCARARGQVLEVAIGTGRNLPYYPPDVRLTGVELSPAMLAVARERAAELGRDVDLREGDAQALPFGDESFDTVVCTLALCSIANDRAALAEMRRVLRPGGRLLLLDHVASTWWPVLMAQRLVDVITIRTSGEYNARRPLALLSPLGFEVVESDRRKAGCVERVFARRIEAGP
jgi:ubiquinone/menaquinone biosynthesis C-methylase UbiE